jgi:hypothetical protein
MRNKKDKSFVIIKKMVVFFKNRTEGSPFFIKASKIHFFKDFLLLFIYFFLQRNLIIKNSYAVYTRLYLLHPCEVSTRRGR